MLDGSRISSEGPENEKLRDETFAPESSELPDCYAPKGVTLSVGVNVVADCQCPTSTLDRARRSAGTCRLGATHGPCFELFSVNDRRTLVGLLHVLPLNGAKIEAFIPEPTRLRAGSGLVIRCRLPLFNFFSIHVAPQFGGARRTAAPTGH